MIMVPILGALDSIRHDSFLLFVDTYPFCDGSLLPREEFGIFGVGIWIYDNLQREAWNDEWESPSCIYVDETENQ
jgi:hypothetical protein